MKIKWLFLKSFYAKVTFSFIISLLCVALLGNFILLKYSLDSQFNQLRDKLKIIAKTAILSINAAQLKDVPLDPSGVNTLAFRKIAFQLLRIKEANPMIRYIYIMAKTQEHGIYQFVVDPDALMGQGGKFKTRSSPGDKYNAQRFPEMLKAFDTPSADNRLVFDEWGNMLSGYAPIRDANNQPIAILGVDIDATDVYLAEQDLWSRGISVVLLGVIFSLLLGSLLSGKIISPIKKLIEGTKRISGGDLAHRVEVPSQDEIGQLAISFNAMITSLSEAREKLQDYFYRVVQSMVRSLEAKDHYTRGHSDRVSDYAHAIAIEMGIDNKKAELLKKAAQLHDIGKLGIHEDILNKTGPLSDSEWDIVRKHPEVGEEILRPVFVDSEMLSVVRSHHERYDGKGYPDGLSSGQAGIYSQIVSVADAYDAMSSSRSYRQALAREVAIAKLKEGSGTQFNPAVVDAFMKVLHKTVY